MAGLTLPKRDCFLAKRLNTNKIAGTTILIRGANTHASTTPNAQQQGVLTIVKLRVCCRDLVVPPSSVSMIYAKSNAIRGEYKRYTRTETLAAATRTRKTHNFHDIHDDASWKSCCALLMSGFQLGLCAYVELADRNKQRSTKSTISLRREYIVAPLPQAS